MTMDEENDDVFIPWIIYLDEEYFSYDIYMKYYDFIADNYKWYTSTSEFGRTKSKWNRI